MQFSVEAFDPPIRPRHRIEAADSNLKCNNQAGRLHGWDKDTTHEIKDAATGGMAGGRTWIGVTPDGTVGINENGRWSPQGHYEDLKP